MGVFRVSKIRGTFLGVLFEKDSTIIGGLYWGPLFLGNYQGEVG